MSVITRKKSQTDVKIYDDNWVKTISNRKQLHLALDKVHIEPLLLSPKS